MAHELLNSLDWFSANQKLIQRKFCFKVS
jgi:hypothetical protein